MDTTGTILTLECSLLAVFLLFIAGLIIFRWRNLACNRMNNGSNALSFNRKYIFLPQTTAQRVQLEKNINQLTDNVPDNGDTTVDCAVIEETINRDDVGRLYFSLAYTSRILTIKLIKGENLPIVSPDASKAYVKVQLISHQMDGKAPTTVKKSINTNYQRTHKFRLSPNEFVSHMIHFEISRFDRFSRKYDVGYVFIALAELQAQGIDLCRENFFTKDITCNKENKFERRKRRRSSNAEQFENSQILHRVLKDSKVRQRKSQVLWKKLCDAVHAGLFEERKKSRNESLQWDPFLIVQRYTECSDSDTSQHTNEEDSLLSDQHKLVKQPDHCQRSSLQEEIPEWSPDVFNSSNESLHFSECSAQTELSPPQCRTQETSSLNQEFYRLVHSSSFTQKESSEPITSWSIPETFRLPLETFRLPPETFRLPPETFQLPPSPVRIQARTVVFQSTSTTHTPSHDRLHKLTSLSSSHRQKIIRKSRRKVRFRRSKLAGKVYLQQSLYLGKKLRHIGSSDNERAYKRMRKTNHDDGKEKVN